MAKLLSDDLTYVSFPINKWEEDADGNLIVTGTVTDGSVDSDHQIVDPTFSAKALTDWMADGPNVRVMHSPSLYPAGRGLQVELGDHAHELKALVVEDTAKKLVRNKVLRAYSVGIADPVIRRDPTGKAPGGIVCGGTLAEVSLVDRPANKHCQLTLAKSADLEDVPWTLGDLDALLAKAEAADPDAVGDESAAPELVDADPLRKVYDVEVAAWAAREPRSPTITAGTGTAFLAKQVARDAWTRWDTEGDENGYSDGEGGYARWVAKRDLDAGVGGGTDRDNIPVEDFADPDRRKYPIVTPGDVSDAAGLAGHADNPDAVRARIRDIAERKGPAFVDALPQSWGKRDMATADLDKSITTTSPDAAGLVPYNLQGAGPSVKGAKTCRACGAEHHADSKRRRCEQCGAKLPKATMKGSDVHTDTLTKTSPLPDGAQPAGEHREPDGSVEELEADADMGGDHDEDTTEHIPAAVKAKKGKKGKGKPFPGAAKPFTAADADDDSGDGGNTEPDDEEEDGGEVAEKSVAAPYTVQRMHDALCAAYPWPAVAAEYPSCKSVTDALVPSWFRDQVTAAATKGDMRAVTVLAGRAQDADALTCGAVEVEKLADARAMLHKAFTDMYPDVRLTPGAPPNPGQFQRPYLSAGHAAAMAPPSRTPTIPPGVHVPDPDDYDRPYISVGHAADSPSNKGNNLDTPTVSTGAARTYYTASKEAARQAMQAMHDHIAGTFPDMCPMAASKSVLPANMGDTARPQPIHPQAPLPAPGESVTKAAGLSDRDLRRLIKQTRKAATADAIKAAGGVFNAELSAIRAEINELGAQPDPAQAPLRGVVRKAATTDEPPRAPSFLEKAQAQAAREAEDRLAFVRGFLNHPNPTRREEAEAELRRLLATTP